MYARILTERSAAVASPRTAPHTRPQSSLQPTPPYEKDQVTPIWCPRLAAHLIRADSLCGGAAPGATSVVVWGEQSINRPVPDGITNAVQVTTGVRHCAALRSDGTVITWGVFDFTAPDEIVIPQPIDLSNVVAIASGKNHVLALKSDGTVVRWGVLNSLRPLMPVGLSNVVATRSAR